jgi:hypothetical protein
MLPGAARLEAEEEQCLVAELEDALGQVVRASGCADMLGLWLFAVSRPRAEFLRAEGVVTGVPEHIAAWKRPMRTKYAALAHWRHVVLWRGVLDRIANLRHRTAVRDMYFTPAPENAPPFSWSKASSRSPAARRYRGPNAFDIAAKAGCRNTLDTIERITATEANGTTVEHEARAAFIDLRPRLGSLRDVLRIEDR